MKTLLSSVVWNRNYGECIIQTIRCIVNQACEKYRFY